MSRMSMSEIHIEIAELLDEGYKATTIAAMLNVPLSMVHDAMVMLDEGSDDYDDFGETDDAYALQSAGFGTDEDYGYYGDE